jgi:formylmethanofuran--tetrahydromethanopterin N-formyltransferase
MTALRVNGVEIDDTFAEAFDMRGARAIVTAETAAWAHTAALVATGYATSVIGCDAEASIEATLGPDESPDGRPGVSVLVFGMDSARLGKALLNRIGQCVMTSPTTACFDGLPEASDRVNVGGRLRFFGDGFQGSKRLDGRRYWRVPVMDGEFVCEEMFGIVRGVAGGNFFVIGADQPSTLAAAESAVRAMRTIRGVALPFPGGMARSGSKLGARYKGLVASTNDAYCPTLRGRTRSSLPEAANAVYEIVFNGLSLAAVETATKVGIEAACRPGVLRITAGNYGGKLGKYRVHLHAVLGEPGGRTATV